jgi:CRISPR type I-E-associated protein CasB/Cse2
VAKIAFLRDEKARDILLNWRKELSRHTVDRAELRRARNTLDIAQVGFFHVLVRRLREGGYEVTFYNREALAVAAALVARIRTHSNSGRFAEQMARKRKGNPVISRMRFRRILSADNLEDLLRELSSAIKIMEERGNIIDLADSVIRWGDWMRRNWLYSYHGNTII